MGRPRGLAAYGGIAGEAHLTLGVRRVQGALRRDSDGKLDPKALVDPGRA